MSAVLLYGHEDLYPYNSIAGVIRRNYYEKMYRSTRRGDDVQCEFTAFAANDPSIKGESRKGIQQAMQAHLEDNSVNGLYTIYDAVTGKLLRLNFDKVHDGIVDDVGFLRQLFLFQRQRRHLL